MTPFFPQSNLCLVLNGSQPTVAHDISQTIIRCTIGTRSVYLRFAVLHTPQPSPDRPFCDDYVGFSTFFIPASSISLANWGRLSWTACNCPFVYFSR